MRLLAYLILAVFFFSSSFSSWVDMCKRLADQSGALQSWNYSLCRSRSGCIGRCDVHTDGDMHFPCKLASSIVCGHLDNSGLQTLFSVRFITFDVARQLQFGVQLISFEKRGMEIRDASVRL